LKGDKTPNGYSSHLFKKHGMCFIKKLLKQLKPFFTTGRLFGKVDATSIILVYKFVAPKKMSTSEQFLVST